MTRCSICNSPKKNAIDDLLDGGAFQRDIAAQFGVSRFALSRHVKHSKPATAAAVPESGDGESLEAQAARWLSRADDIYDRSIVDGDVRGQVQALTGAFRGLELQHRAELKAAEAAPPTGDAAPVTIEEIDRIVHATLNETPRGRHQSRLFSAPDKVLELAAKLADSPSAWTTVERILESTQVNS
jgi:hypothetical protein